MFKHMSWPALYRAHSLPPNPEVCKAAGGKSGITKQVCNGYFLTTVKYDELVMSMVPGTCGLELNAQHAELNPHFMEVLTAHLMKYLKQKHNTLKINTYDTLKEYASGLKWRKVYGAVPPKGTELVNEVLLQALQGKTDFSQTEWDAFDVNDLRYDHYIGADASYFQPAEPGGFKITYSLAKGPPFTEIIQEEQTNDANDANIKQIIKYLKGLFHTIDTLFEECQFQHGDMKCEQVLMMENETKDQIEAILNDFDKSSFTVKYKERFLRCRPKSDFIRQQGWTYTHSPSIPAKTLQFSPQMKVRSLQCPMEDGNKFDKQCLLASVLLNASDSVKEGLLKKLQEEEWEEWVDVDKINEYRAKNQRHDINLKGNHLAGRCVKLNVKKIKPQNLDSTVPFTGDLILREESPFVMAQNLLKN